MTPSAHAHPAGAMLNYSSSIGAFDICIGVLSQCSIVVGKLALSFWCCTAIRQLSYPNGDTATKTLWQQYAMIHSPPPRVACIPICISSLEWALHGQPSTAQRRKDIRRGEVGGSTWPGPGKANFRHLRFAKMLIFAVSHSYFYLTIS